MNLESASARKVIYNLRPAKQVERRMLLDALQVMGEAGFGIRGYQYTGMGSLYFVDFVLFYRLLGMTDMLTVEMDLSLESRIRYNLPFGPIVFAPVPIGEVIPELSLEKQHLLWLDYDFRMNEVVVQDVGTAAVRLTPGSILLVTVDVKPPNGETPREWRQYYERYAGEYFGLGWNDATFAESDLAWTNSRILFNTIIRNLPPGKKFFPLFNFAYSDGHPMLTIGGVVGSDDEAELISDCDFDNASYIRTSTEDKPYEIMVPRLTHKERMHLDSYMPCADEWLPKEFVLSKDEVHNYREVYRFYPSYVEILG